MALLMTLSRTTSCIFYEPGRKACIIIQRPSEIHKQHDAQQKEFPLGKSGVMGHISVSLACWRAWRSDSGCQIFAALEEDVLAYISLSILLSIYPSVYVIITLNVTVYRCNCVKSTELKQNKACNISCFCVCSFIC